MPGVTPYFNGITAWGAGLGVEIKRCIFLNTATTDAFAGAVQQYAAHNGIGGIVLGWPLPRHVNAKAVEEALPFQKDPDHFIRNNPLVFSPAVRAVCEVIARRGTPLRDARIAIIGHGHRIGWPLYRYFTACRGAYGYRLSFLSARWLADPAGGGKEEVEKAGIVIAGARTNEWRKRCQPRSGALVIDFTARGIGPLLIAHLFQNFYRLNP